MKNSVYIIVIIIMTKTIAAGYLQLELDIENLGKCSGSQVRTILTNKAPIADQTINIDTKSCLFFRYI